MTPEQAVALRLRANHLDARLPAGSFCAAARYGLQDTAPRDALLSLHARVTACPPEAWEAPGLVQTYGPRQAVYVLPEAAFAAFTVGRTSWDDGVAEAVDRQAEQVCRDLAGEEREGALHPELRGACVSGRIAVRWTASRLIAREVPRPAVDLAVARAELVRLHVAAFGPTTRATFGWWAGLPGGREGLLGPGRRRAGAGRGRRTRGVAARRRTRRGRTRCGRAVPAGTGPAPARS